MRREFLDAAGGGQFRNASGATLRERAKVLILLYAHDGVHSRNIMAIRAAYLTTFEQESLLRVDVGSCVFLRGSVWRCGSVDEHAWQKGGFFSAAGSFRGSSGRGVTG
jgi:hypothetical protein